MQRIFNLPETLEEELNKFEQQTERFKNGSISAVEFRAFRVPQGVYEQREAGMHMLRVRLPAGALLPHQMRTLASVARKHGNGVLHVTTRQDIQVHGVGLDDIHPALVELYGAGLSTKGGGGNTVRNITACCNSGVCALEAFDVAPYAVALTEFLLPDPLNYQLPRKYKIAFSGCPSDCAGATVNDLGFIARLHGEERGFALFAAGGMGARSQVASLLEEFVPAGEAHLVAEAVKRVFDRHGNRKNKHKARLRFLVEQIGFEAFRRLYADELSHLRKSGLPALEVRDLPRGERVMPPMAEKPSDGFTEWSEKNVAPQKQVGRCIVQIPLLLGDIAAQRLAKLADLVEEHGEGMVRITQWQNLVVRWAHEKELPALHRKLTQIGLARTPVPILRDIVACAGASTCKLGICLSRGLALAVIDRLARDGLDLGKLEGSNIHISGCPNSCGRHPIGQIGLYGAARRAEGRLVPHYVVQLGGRVGEGNTRLAEGKEAIPARNVPDFVVDLLRAFRQSPHYPDYDAFLEAGGMQTAARLLSTYKHIPSFEEDKNYYFDWGAETLFSLAGRGPGECGVGVFDLIEVDLASADEALREGKLLAAAVLAARALLVTQGQEAKDDAEALDLFVKHFLDVGLVSDSLRPLIERARRSVLSAEPDDTSDATPGEVSALVQAVQKLYNSMDSSLRFRPVAQEVRAESKPGTPAGVETDRQADFRAVGCPLNYVKTKLLLDQMTKGQVLSVLVDSEGAGNVPESVRGDGHQVLSVAQEGDHWRVLIRRS